VRFAIIRSSFNNEITQALLDGAMRGFADEHIGEELVDRFDVPGSFELPLAALWAAQSKRYNAIVCVGCVVRGDTPHFEYVAGEAARGIADVARSTGVPVIFGVLTTDTLDQARSRAASDAAGVADHSAPPGDAGAGRAVAVQPSNKGYEAARSAVAMAQLRRKFD
jgi:6,7-dimethyl-8-ribityllumazine synthase